MSMSRRDYELIARTIRAVWTNERYLDSPSHALEVVAASLADALGQDNPRFNEDKFLEACKIPQTNQ